jgi:hypothetical protein
MQTLALRHTQSSTYHAFSVITPNRTALRPFALTAIALKELVSQSEDVKLHDVNRLLHDYPDYKRDHVFHDTLNQYDGLTCPYVLHSSSRLRAVVRFGAATRG